MEEPMIRSRGQAVLRQIADEYVLIPTGEMALQVQKLICLTESSAMLWKMLAEGTTEQAMWQALLDTYEVDEATARKDTAEFLENMKALGLL